MNVNSAFISFRSAVYVRRVMKRTTRFMKAERDRCDARIYVVLLIALLSTARIFVMIFLNGFSQAYILIT